MVFYGYFHGFLLAGNGHILNSGDLVGRGHGGFGFHFFGLYPGFGLAGSGGLTGGNGGCGFGGSSLGFFGYFGGLLSSKKLPSRIGTEEDHQLKRLDKGTSRGASQIPARRSSGSRQRKTSKPKSAVKLPTTALPPPTRVFVLAKP